MGEEAAEGREVGPHIPDFTSILYLFQSFRIDEFFDVFVFCYLFCYERFRLFLRHIASVNVKFFKHNYFMVDISIQNWLTQTYIYFHKFHKLG